MVKAFTKDWECPDRRTYEKTPEGRMINAAQEVVSKKKMFCSSWEVKWMVALVIGFQR